MSDEVDYLDFVARTWTCAYGGAPHQDPVLYALVGLAGEAGEVANIAAEIMREGWSENLRKRLLDELGGVFRLLYQACWRLNISPAEVRALDARRGQTTYQREK